LARGRKEGGGKPEKGRREKSRGYGGGGPRKRVSLGDGRLFLGEGGEKRGFRKRGNTGEIQVIGGLAGESPYFDLASTKKEIPGKKGGIVRGGSRRNEGGGELKISVSPLSKGEKK